MVTSCVKADAVLVNVPAGKSNLRTKELLGLIINRMIRQYAGLSDFYRGKRRVMTTATGWQIAKPLGNRAFAASLFSDGAGLDGSR
jgi:hypothetical protein